MDPASINYRIDGAGARLVLLHPVGLDLTCFDALVMELSPCFQVLRLDMRGHGLTPGTENGPDPQLEDFADDVHALLQYLDFAPAAVIGFSFGGMVAQTLTLNHPFDVSALVSGACGASLSDEARALLRKRGMDAEQNGMASVVEATMERWFTPAFRQRGGDAAARLRVLCDDIQSWKQTWNAIAGLSNAPRLHEIAVPTLCLAAEKDISATPAVVKSVSESIPGARFTVVPGTPHMLFIEQPKAVAAAITEFLDSLA